MKVTLMKTNSEGFPVSDKNTVFFTGKKETGLELTPNSNTLCVLLENIPDIPDGYRLEQPGDREYERPADSKSIPLSLTYVPIVKWGKAHWSLEWRWDNIYVVPENWDPQIWPKWTKFYHHLFRWENERTMIPYDLDESKWCFRVPRSLMYTTCVNAEYGGGHDIISEAEAKRLIVEAEQPNAGAEHMVDPYSGASSPVCVCGEETCVYDMSMSGHKKYPFHCRCRYCGRAGPRCKTVRDAIEAYLNEERE